MKTSKYITGSSNLMRDNIVTSNQAVSYRNVDLLKMLVYGYENVYNTLDDYGHEFDIMIEAKHKELALLKYRQNLSVLAAK